MFAGAVSVGDDELGVGIGTAIAHEYELLPVGRETDCTIYVLDQQARSTTQHRNLVEHAEVGSLRLDTHEIKVVIVRGNGQTGVASLEGGQDLLVAAGGDVAHPDALRPTAVIVNVEQVSTIGCNGCELDLTGIAQPFHAHVLERGWRAASTAFEQEISGRSREDQQHDPHAEDQPSLAPG